MPDLARYKWTFALVGIVLLLLPFVPGVGFAAPDGARLWVSVGPINFQPGEFAKLALALFFAAYLTERRELLAAGTWKVGPFHLPEPRHLGPLFIAWGASLVVLIGQKDMGSSLLFFALFVVLLWVATERVSWLAIGAVLFAAGSFVAWNVIANVQDRVDIWLNPWQQRDGKGFQLVQSTFALAWGKLTGTGLGLGDPTRIPEVKNDFIFAAFGEELGLLGGTAMIVAYLLMVGSGLRIAIQAERTFEKLLATGLTTILGIQAFVIIGGVTRVRAAHRRHPPVRQLRRFVARWPTTCCWPSSCASPTPARSSAATSPAASPGGSGEPSAGRTRPRPGRGGRPTRRRRGRRAGVNRQIRTLGIGLMVLFVALFIQLNVVQVVRADRYDADPGNNRTVVRDFTRPRGPIVTADGAVMAESVPSSDRYRYQRRYPTGELFANVSGYFSFTLGSTQLERTAERRAQRHTPHSRAAGSREPVQRPGQHRRRRHDAADRHPAGGQAGARRPRRQRRPARPPHRRHQGAVELPELRPEPHRHPRLRGGQGGQDRSTTPTRASRCWPTATRSATCPARRSRSSPPPRRWRAASTRSTRTSRRPSSYIAAPDHQAHPQLRRPTCGGTFVEVFRRSCNTAFAEMAVNVGAPDMVATAERYGFNGAPPFDLPRPGAVGLRDRRRLREQHPARSPSPASAQGNTAGHAAADGPGRRRPWPTAARS